MNKVFDLIEKELVLHHMKSEIKTWCNNHPIYKD